MSIYQKQSAARRGQPGLHAATRNSHGHLYSFGNVTSPASMQTPPSIYHSNFKQHNHFVKNRSDQSLFESPSIQQQRVTPFKEAFSSGKRQHNLHFQLNQRSQYMPSSITQAIQPSADGLFCSRCQFKFPTSRHLIKCSNCIQDIVRRRGLKGSSESSSSMPGNKLTIQKDEVFQVCKDCLETKDNEKSGLRQLMACPTCCFELEDEQSGSKSKIESYQFQLSPYEKTSLLKMQQFRMVIPNLLYVIGLPRKFAHEDTIRQPRFFGQFGKIMRVLINHYTKDFYEQQGQCALYIWYESEVNVAIALKCLNGLRIQTTSQMQHNSSQAYAQTTILKCSFGTSKYCLNFLKEATCENFKPMREKANAKGHVHHCSQTSSDSLDRDSNGQSPIWSPTYAPCPFLHYIERRRDKVIQDDIEFKDYLVQQERIVDDFMTVLGVQTVASKNDYYTHQQHYNSNQKEMVSRMGLPCPSFVLGNTLKQIMKQAKLQNRLPKVKEVLYLRGFFQEVPRKLSPCTSSSTMTNVVSLPALSPVRIQIHYYKRGSKSSTDVFNAVVAATATTQSLTDLVHSLDQEIQQQIRQNLTQLMQQHTSQQIHQLTSQPQRVATNFQGYYPPNDGTVQMTEYFRGVEPQMQVGPHRNPQSFNIESQKHEDTEKARKRAEKLAERMKMKQMVEESLKSKVNAEPWDPSRYQSRIKDAQNEPKLLQRPKTEQSLPTENFKNISASSTDKNSGFFNKQIDQHQRAVVADCINELGIFCDEAPVQDPELFSKRVQNTTANFGHQNSFFQSENETGNQGKENKDVDDNKMVLSTFTTQKPSGIREAQFPSASNGTIPQNDVMKRKDNQSKLAKDLRI